MLKAMSIPQGVLKMFMLGVLKTILKTVLKYEKTPSHFTARVEIERQISFFSFGFARVTEVRHMSISGRKKPPLNFLSEVAEHLPTRQSQVAFA